METTLEDYIIKRSNIPKDFLTDFFHLGGNTYCDTYKKINFDDLVKWLDVQKNHLKRLLIDNFKIIDDYTKHKILVKNKKKGKNYVSNIMLTPDCFKELCMLSQTDKAKEIRKNYIVAEGLLRNHFEQIIINLNKELGLIKNNLKKPIEVIGGHIYILGLLIGALFILCLMLKNFYLFIILSLNLSKLLLIYNYIFKYC